MSPTVSILGILHSDGLADRVKSSISEQRYILKLCGSQAEFLRAIQETEPNPDCLILEATPELPSLITHLHQHSILLPSLILSASESVLTEPGAGEPVVGEPVAVESATRLHPSQSPPILSEGAQQNSRQQYHPAQINLGGAALGKLETSIDEAIKQFLQLSPSDPLLQALPPPENPLHSGVGLLQDQQRRLADKLRERLGYLGIYYKRDPRLFLRNLEPEEVTEVLSSLKLQYKGIVLSYFTENGSANATIDEFVNAVFFSDISVTKIVEIHMELMDEFSKQLKLEGRSEEILVDYRLTLLDIVAHLCEMYRRSIPRES